VKLLPETTSSNPPKEVICQVGVLSEAPRLSVVLTVVVAGSVCSLVQLCCIKEKFRALCDPNF
jgi:hypothetical protein